MNELLNPLQAQNRMLRESSLLECDAMLLGKWFPTFERTCYHSSDGETEGLREKPCSIVTWSMTGLTWTGLESSLSP